MAPPTPQRPISKARFPTVFGAFRSQTYHDPSARGAGSHAWTPLLAQEVALSTFKLPVGNFEQQEYLKTVLQSFEHIFLKELKDIDLNSLDYLSPVKPRKTVQKSFHTRASLTGWPLRSSNKDDSIRCISWNPTGTLIATGAVDKTLRVWNPEKPSVRNTTDLKGHSASIEKVAFNPVKDAELCSVSADGVLKIWDVRAGKCINEISGLGSAVSLAWHPDGTSIIVGNKVDNLYIIDPAKPEPLAEHQQDVQTNEIFFTWGGETVFVATGEGRVKILSYPDLKPALHRPWEEKPFTLHGHTSACLSVALQPTARYLASGGSDSIISLWDTKEWICQRTLTNMTGPVRNISFSWCGMYIVGGSDEGTSLEIAHVEDGEYVHTIKTQSPSAVVAWHPTKYLLAYTDFGGLKIIGPDPDAARK